MKMKNVLVESLKDIVWQIRFEYQESGMMTYDLSHEIKTILKLRSAEKIEQFIQKMEVL